tara:strand:+ start:180 stop:371 length:192 start_codon:yes stop_codon:yes gene_type:complete
MSDLYIHEKLFKVMAERRGQIEAQITEGAVEDFSAFKELRARLAELAFIKQELQLLLKKVEYD